MARDPWLDNVKILLVTFVVIGHAWGQLEPRDDALWLYDFVYAWHIPAFVLVSGHLSRSVTWSRESLVAAVTMLLVPYLLFDPAIYFFRWALGYQEPGPLWLQPHWTMWYLIVLFLWRLATPVLTAHWSMVPLSVVVSLVAGTADLPVLDLNRFLGLLPFFVMGLHLDRAALTLLPRVRALKPIAVLALAWIFTLADHTEDLTEPQVLWYDSSYAGLGLDVGEGMLTRLTVLGTGVLGTLAVLALIPRGRSWLTTLGSATMVVYLFHGFLIRAVEFSGVLEFSADWPVVALVVTGVSSALVAFLLASPPVARVLGPLTDPLAGWRQRVRDRAA